MVHLKFAGRRADIQQQQCDEHALFDFALSWKICLGIDTKNGWA